MSNTFSRSRRAIRAGGSVGAGGFRVLSVQASTCPSRNSTFATPPVSRKWTLGFFADGGSAIGVSTSPGEPGGTIGVDAAVAQTASQKAIVRLVLATWYSFTGVQT